MQGVPPFMIKRYLFIAPLPAILSAGPQFISLAMSGRMHWSVWLLMPASMTVFLLLITRSNRRIKRQLAAAGFRVCWHCGYDLSASEERGHCPECGTEYTASDLHVKWSHTQFYQPPLSAAEAERRRARRGNQAR